MYRECGANPLHSPNNVCLTLTALLETIAWKARGNGAFLRTQAKLALAITLTSKIGTSDTTDKGKRKLNACKSRKQRHNRLEKVVVLQAESILCSAH